MTASRPDQRYLKRRQWGHGVGYYWSPPAALKKAGVFEFVTLGPDPVSAAFEAARWNRKLDAYRRRVKPPSPDLRIVLPMSAAYVARRFETSAKSLPLP